MQTILGRAGHVFVRFTLFNFNSISVINAKNLDQVLLANLSSVNRLIYFYFFHLFLLNDTGDSSTTECTRDVWF